MAATRHTEAMFPRTSASVPLAAEPCQSLCRWLPTDAGAGDAATGSDRVFACIGCGSEWTRTEPWTPADADGVVPPEVVAERDRD